MQICWQILLLLEKSGHLHFFCCLWAYLNHTWHLLQHLLESPLWNTLNYIAQPTPFHLLCSGMCDHLRGEYSLNFWGTENFLLLISDWESYFQAVRQQSSDHRENQHPAYVVNINPHQWVSSAVAMQRGSNRILSSKSSFIPTWKQDPFALFSFPTLLPCISG